MAQNRLQLARVSVEFARSLGVRYAHSLAPGKCLVSRIVTDLVTGSGIRFLDRGEQELKGVPGSWRLFAVLD